MTSEYEVQYFKNNKHVETLWFNAEPIEAELKDVEFEYDRYEIWKITKEQIGSVVTSDYLFGNIL